MNAASKVEAATLHSAMARAFAVIGGATKDKVNPHFNKKYADLGSVIDAIKQPLIDQGLFFAQISHPAEDGVCVETIVGHENGDQMSFGKLFVPADKRDAQKFGSALTYARRYGLMTAFGVPAEDDDGNAAVASKPTPKADPAPQPRAGRASAEQCALIIKLAPAAGFTVQGVVEGYKVSSLEEIKADDAAKAIAKLERLATPKPTPTVEDVLDDEIPY